MPLSKKAASGANKTRGDLIVRIEVEFPARLTGAQTKEIKKIFG